MKKKRIIDIIDIVPIVFGVIALLIGIIISASSCNNQKEVIKTNQYPLTTIVTEINEEKDLVSVTDSNGYVWQFYGVEDWEEGDICSIIMDNNGTKEILDDTIIKVQYGGRF